MRCARLVARSVRLYHATRASLELITERVPPLGESTTEGTISKWMKTVNDSVTAGDVVLVVETDKVTVDIKATVSGVLVEILATDNVKIFYSYNQFSATHISLCIQGRCWHAVVYGGNRRNANRFKPCRSDSYTSGIHNSTDR